MKRTLLVLILSFGSIWVTLCSSSILPFSENSRPNLADTSLMNEHLGVVRANLKRCIKVDFHQTKEAKASTWTDWRFVLAVAALRELTEIYTRYAAMHEEKTALYEAFILAFCTIDAPPARRNEADLKFKSFMKSSAVPFMEMLRNESFYREILCDSKIDGREFFCDTSSTIKADGKRAEAEQLRRWSFCEGRLPNSAFGLSQKTVETLDSLPARHTPIFVIIGGRCLETRVPNRDSIAEFLFDYIKEKYKLKRTQLLLPGDITVDPREVIHTGMRLGTLFLIAHHPDTGVLCIVGHK